MYTILKRLLVVAQALGSIQEVDMGCWQQVGRIGIRGITGNGGRFDLSLQMTPGKEQTHVD